MNSKGLDYATQTFLQKRHMLLYKQGQRTMGPSQHLTVHYIEGIKYPVTWMGITHEYLCVCVCLSCVTLLGVSTNSLTAVSSLTLPVHHLRRLDPSLSSPFLKPVSFSLLSNWFGSFCNLFIQEQSLLRCKWIWRVPTTTVLQIISGLGCLLRVKVSWHLVPD